MNKEDFEQKLGKHILSAIDQFQKNKKDFGQELVIPFKMPRTSNEPDFTFSVKVQMPRFSVFNSDESITSFTMAEYCGWDKA